MRLQRIYLGLAVRRALRVLWLGTLLAPGACSKRPAPLNSDAREVYARGDRVLVELAAAQFFEGRVLAAEAERLRVQAIGSNDAVKVVASDVYRLPPTRRDLTPNLLAVCGREKIWEPCRLLSVAGSVVHATDAAGAEFELAFDQVLVPSALTELNLKRYFERVESELLFARSARRAGEPRVEPGWHPALHERLLVKVAAEWFTGYVREIGEEQAEVALNRAERSATVSLAALAAEPPSSFVNDLRRGDFVLVRPRAPADPWLRWQIRAVNDKELQLADAAGVLKSVSMREVVPLRP